MLILASSSPRRHDLLTAAGIEHRVQPAFIPEVRKPGEESLDFVKRLAEEKARAVESTGDDVVLGADTIVCLEHRGETQLLGKPADEQDAARMLGMLSGRCHWVHTGVCLLSKSGSITDVSSTAVRFATLTEREIREYTRSGEPMDKAGAYAIQGLASKFVLSIEGSYQNVVGLPVSLVYRHLKALGS